MIFVLKMVFIMAGALLALLVNVVFALACVAVMTVRLAAELVFWVLPPFWGRR